VPSAVIYVQDLAGMQAFYERVAKLTVSEVGDDYVEMADLLLVALPPEIADAFRIASPPERREEAAVKLVFDVPVLAAARVRATQLGGVLDAAGTEWEFGPFRVCEGHDPEGNPLQLREPV
jgi:predicted enzyme related to lactoylglutathione lyase